MVLKFVVQEHTTPEGVHWDLMLEQDGTLATFRLEREPAHCLSHEVRAEKIFDHPMRFLTHEGPVQKGAGKVRIVDSGVYQRRDREDRLWVLDMKGAVLCGVFSLDQVADVEWRFRFEGPLP